MNKKTMSPAMRLIASALIACLASEPVYAGVVDIATTPLASSNGASVLPNLLFTLDNSGSMGWEFLPDYVDPNTSGLTSQPCLPDSSGSVRCTWGDPPFNAGGQFGFNGVGYDPNFNYVTAVKSDGTPYNSQPLSTTSLQIDAFNTSSGTVNLTNGLTDQKYCNSSANTTCLRNGAAVATGVVNPNTATKDPNGNTVSAGQFPYRTNVSSASDPAVVAFGLPEMMSIASFSRSGSTVTATVAGSTTGLTTSNFVYVTGTSSLNVNCVAVASVGTTASGAGFFTYSTGSGTVSATNGSYRKCVNLTTASAFSRASGSGTVTVSSTGHGLVTGDIISVFNTTVTAFNVSSTTVTVTGSNSFTYSSSSGTSSAQSAGSWVRTGLYNRGVNITNSPAYSYYITPAEWCSDVNLTACVEVISPATPPAGYFPAYVRFCQTQAQAMAPGSVTGNDASGNPLCRSKYVNTSGLPAYMNMRYGQFNRDTIVSGLTFHNRPSRTDCVSPAAPDCDYTHEIQNYARWYTYYRTRIQMMKTSVGRSFIPFISSPPAKPDSLRVGFITIHAEDGGSIDTNQYLKINNFNTTQASSFYTTFYNQTANNATPLQEALARAGWIFAGKMNTGLTKGISVNDDPVQASCQRNFSLMTTDGYWNGNLGQTVAGKSIGNLDNVDPTFYPQVSGAAVYASPAVDRATTGTLDGVGGTTSVNTPATTLEQVICTGSGNASFADGSTTPCGCTGSQKRVKQRTTVKTTTVTTTEGVNPTTTNTSTNTYQNITACNSLVVTQTTPVTETAQRVDPEGNPTNSDFSAAANGSNPQTSYTCTGSGTRTVLLQRVLGYNKIVTTTDGGAPVTTFSGLTSGPTFTTVTACSTAAKTAAATVVSNGTTTTTNNGGATISSANFTISPNPQTSTGTQFGSSTPGGVANTLADTALYFYENDLRGGTDNNGDATGPTKNLGGTGTVDVSANNIPVASNALDYATHQHMVTFTVGMADGLMRYQPDYATATSGDFFNIKAGTPGACFWTPGFCDWPAPSANEPSALDDLWHAAVNGRGQFYQALNANALSAGISGALSALNTQVAAAAASATSSPNVTQTNHQIFSTIYETNVWSGRVFAQNLDPTTGAVVPNVLWQADQQILTQITPTSDTRNIFTRDAVAGGLKPLQWANLTTTEQGWFGGKCISPAALSQCSGLSGSLPPTPTGPLGTANDGPSLLGFLRGQTGNEGTAFRKRLLIDPVTNASSQTVLGDTVDSQPLYVAAPVFSYTDAVTPSYTTFQTANATRNPEVYVGANDGYLHAFDANTGLESWAYAPRFLLNGMYVLADTNYAIIHRFFVDGSPVSGDVFDTSASAWKTLLVGGSGVGGRGYYALDVTDPGNPKGLWEFCADTTMCPVADTDLGVTTGNPVIGKRSSDGKWVVVVTSGLNNGLNNSAGAQANPGSGGGFFFVLDAITGAVLSKVPTNVGTATTPSGLDKISAYYNSAAIDATFQYVYGGDQLGNVWRLDLGTATAPTPVVTHMTTLMDAATGSTPAPRTQPITTRPLLTSLNGNRVLYVGTGRYLGGGDLADPGAASGIAWQQTLYAFKDKGSDYGNIRDDANMVKNLLTQQGGNRGITDPSGANTAANTTMNWTVKDGWFVDFNPHFTGDPAAGNSPGERVVIDPQIFLGVVEVVTDVPTVTGSVSCVSGGTSFIYFLDFNSGLPISGTVAGYPEGQLIVGFVTVQTSDGSGHNDFTCVSGQCSGQGLPPPVPPTKVKRFSYRAF